MLTLSGSNTYTGATNVNAGILALGPGGSLANTAVTVGNGVSGNATLQVGGNYTIGTGSGAPVTLAEAAAGTGQGRLIFNTAEAGPSTLTINGNLVLGGSSAGNPSLLGFNLNSSSVRYDCHQRQPDGQSGRRPASA